MNPYAITQGEPNESTQTYRQKARQAYSKLQPTHEEVVVITDRESYVSSSRMAKAQRGVTPRGALTKSFLGRQSAKGRALLRDWKQGGHGWLSDGKPHNIVRVILENYNSLKYCL